MRITCANLSSFKIKKYSSTASPTNLPSGDPFGARVLRLSLRLRIFSF